MTQAFDYQVMPDPDGQGWIVTAEGHVARSLAYDSREEAVEVAEELVCQHPGSTIVVTDQPPALTPIEIEHRLSA